MRSVYRRLGHRRLGHRWLSCGLLLSLVSGCAMLGTVKTEGFAREDVIGVWTLTHANAQRLRVEQLALLADGRKCSVNLSFEAGEGVAELRSQGRWRLTDDSIVTTLEYSASAWLLEGDVLRQQVVSASPSQLQLRWDSQEVSQPRPVSAYQRASGVSGEALCQLAGPRVPAGAQAPVADAASR